MTTVTCKGYRAVHLPGEIRLEIEELKPDALADKISMGEIAELLDKSVKSVDRLSRRRRNPLPLHRQEGIRPFALRYELNRWLESVGRFPTGLGSINLL